MVNCGKKEHCQNNLLLKECFLELTSRELKKNFNQKFIISDYDYEMVWVVKRCSGKSSNSLVLESCTNTKDITRITLLVYKHLEDETRWNDLPCITKILSSSDLQTLPIEIMELYTSKKKVEFKIDSLNKNLFTSMDDIVKDYRNLMNNEQLSDVQLVVRNEKFFAHKLILSSRSTVFAAVFYFDLLDKQKGVFEIKDQKPEIFKLLLNFIYTGQIDQDESINWLELLSAAHHYDVPSLKSICARRLADNLSIDNAIDVYVLSDKVKDFKLKKISARFIILNKSLIVDTDKYEKMITTNADLAVQLFRSVMSNEYSIA